jgi:hypothetical protein
MKLKSPILGLFNFIFLLGASLLLPKIPPQNQTFACRHRRWR